MTKLKVERISTDDEIGRAIHEKIVCDYCQSYVLVGDERTCIPEQYLQFADEIQNFEVKNDDIWVASYPKTGTTWTQEMVWMIANNLDFEGGKEPLEFLLFFDQKKVYTAIELKEDEYNLNSVEFAAKQKSPRFIKTHLPFSLLPDQIKNGTKSPKIIYVWRNPKDTCVSYYHHGTLFQGWRTDLETFAEIFMADKAMYGSYWKNIFGYWEHRNSPNILFIKYEDMKTNLPSVIRQVAKFLEKDLTDEQIELLTKHLSFESMKNNPSVNFETYLERLRRSNFVVKDGSFIRTGVVGKYKEELSPEIVKKLDEWIKKNVTGTSFEQEYNFNL
ncbi:hypothetical protein ILUMI_17353 [Ignelater luminosus]|uniref:Sulfotransferase domain-containing protein n=1 Tax=Ignelater luminosus TaxID=2038154 RepID=A0A8K0CSH1_IGNLU|nr:hypothetical protein ILUMI_17353 [Ignelater luminosus]